MNIGIDATNINSGGGINHITSIINFFENKNDIHVNKIVIWANQNILNKIKNKNFIYKQNTEILSRYFFLRVIWQYFCFSRALRKFDCNLVFTPGGYQFSNFSPSIVLIQNMEPFSNLNFRRNLIEIIKLKLKRKIMLFSIKKAKGLIFLHQSNIEQLKKFINFSMIDFSIISHGISDEYFKNHKNNINIDNQKEIKIVYNSTICSYKNQIEIIKAVDHLRQKNFNLQLHLIGPKENVYFEKLNREVLNSHDLDEIVIFHGLLDTKQIIELYKKFDIALFASSSEALPITLLEKMAIGLPIVCSDMEPMKSILHEDTIKFNPKNIISISNAIEFLIKKKDMNAYCHNNFLLSKKYDWRKSSINTFRFFKQIYSINARS